MKWVEEQPDVWIGLAAGVRYEVTASGNGMWHYTWDRIPSTGRMNAAGHLWPSREEAQAEAEEHWRR